MEVIGFDPALPKDAAAKLGIQLMDLPDVWAKADFITLHTPLTPDTQDLVNDESIAQVRYSYSTVFDRPPWMTSPEIRIMVECV